MNGYRTGALVTTAVVAMVTATPLLAQSMMEDPAAAGEIIVTAQRREERLQDVPLSVTAISGASLAEAGVATTRDLGQVVPGLRLEGLGVYVQPVVRGISTSLTGLEEPNVATYIDGVYQVSSYSGFYNLPDVKQIEVLKGPQGTLFGRNATGGAILIHTLDPDLNEITGRISLGYGRFNSVEAKAFVSLPLARETLAMSLTGYAAQTDGYKRNLLDGNRRDGAGSSDVLVRAKLRLKPSAGADFVLSGYYARRRDNSALKLSNLNGNNFQRPWAIQNGQPIASRPWEYAVDVDTNTRSQQNGVSLRGTVEAGPGGFTTTTAYEELRTQFVNDPDNSPRAFGTAFQRGRQRAFSQEVVYTTDQLGRFRGVLGAFYFNRKGTVRPNSTYLALAGTLAERAEQVKVESYALFGELTYDLTDQLSLTAGLRYSHEKKRAFAASVAGPANVPLPLASDISVYLALPSRLPAIQPFLGEASWNSVTPRASLLYRVGPQTNVYLTFSQGFKSGTFNTSSLQQAPVNPEKVTSYEAGLKTEIDRNLTFNAAGFYYDYTDLQAVAITQINGQATSRLTNAATARIYGLEINADWEPNEAFKLSFGGTYLHARYKDFVGAPDNIPVAGGGNAAVVVDASGNSLIRSPEWTGNVTARYRVALGESELDLSGSAYYSSRIFFDPSNRVNQPAYATLNAAVAWRPAAESGLELRLWGRNLTNKAVIASTILTSLWDAVDYNPPRTYGVELNYKW